MNKRALLALFAALLVAAVAAGCGGGGDSSTDIAPVEIGSTPDESGSTEESESGGPAPTKAAFVKEADEICSAKDSAINEEIVTYAEKEGIEIQKEEPSTDQQVQIFENVVIPKLNEEHDELAALTPPEGDEDAVGEILDSLGSGIEDIESDPSQLGEGDNPLEDASEKASDYGLKTCGQG